jgi:hypothetical protein
MPRNGGRSSRSSESRRSDPKRCNCNICNSPSRLMTGQGQSATPQHGRVDGSFRRKRASGRDRAGGARRPRRSGPGTGKTPRLVRSCERPPHRARRAWGQFQSRRRWPWRRADHRSAGVQFSGSDAAGSASSLTRSGPHGGGSTRLTSEAHLASLGARWPATTRAEAGLPAHVGCAKSRTKTIAPAALLQC